MQRKSLLVATGLAVTAFALLVSLGGSSVATAGADGAKLVRKQLASRIPYRLSLRFDGTYTMQSGGSGVTGEEEENTAFVASRGGFWLVRSGTAAKPLYTLASSDGTPLMLQVSGPLSFAGTGHFVLQTCSYGVTMALKGDRTADVFLTLVKNRLHLSISSEAKVSYQQDAGCRYEREYTTNPHLSAFGAPLPARLKVIDVKKVLFGQSFTLIRRMDPIAWPALHRPFKTAGGTGYEEWTYDWRLVFTPVKAR